VVSASEDGVLMVWDGVKGTPSYSIRRHVDGDLVSSVNFNERYLVTDGTSANVHIWDFAIGPPPRRAPPQKKKSKGGRGGGPGRGPGGPGGPNPNNPNPSPNPPPNNGMPPPPPNTPRFPFIGGWNLGGGPSDLGDIGGAPGMEGGPEGPNCA
jgi:hypothetical protein